MRLQRLLMQAGASQVHQAASASQALLMLGEGLVDVAFTVWKTAEGPHGEVLMKRLRNHRQNRNVPVVLLDDGLATEERVRAVKAGATGRIPLPAQWPMLQEVLQEVLQCLSLLSARGQRR